MSDEVLQRGEGGWLGGKCQPASQARVGRSQGQGHCGGGVHDERLGPYHCCYIVATPPSLLPHHSRFVASVVTSSIPLHSTPIDGLDTVSESPPLLSRPAISPAAYSSVARFFASLLTISTSYLSSAGPSFFWEHADKWPLLSS